MLVARLAIALALLVARSALPQDAPPRLARFKSVNNTFYLDLPAGFRQLAPNEALQLAEKGPTPTELRTTSPRQFYAVGAVDDWLRDGITSPWLHVMEQGNEWFIEGDFAEQLKQRWTEASERSEIRYDVTDIRAAEVGPMRHAVHLAIRTQTPRSGPSIRSLDVHAATGGRQVTLSLCAWAEDYERFAPEFDRWLSTLTFSRPPKGKQELSDRLWTPLLTGAVVGIVLLVLYKHTRRSR